MARTIKLLASKEVEKLKVPGLHPVGPSGLYLQILGPTSRSWIYRYTMAGKARWAGLGSAGADGIGLAEARAKREEMRAKIVAGIDPVGERKQQRQPMASRTRKTFRQVAADYIANQEASWKSPIHRAQWSATLKAYAYPVIGDKPVDEIATDDIREILAPIWHSKAETARRVRGRIERILDAAKVLGLRDGQNPAAWAGHLANVFPGRKRNTVQHHPAMPYDDVPGFMEELRARDGIAARALEFTILTAARTNETLGARWDELDLGGRVWVIPGVRMKGGKEHRVPLADRAMEILQEMAGIRLGDFVFPGMRADSSLSNMAMLQVIARLNRAEFTVHGFRSSFRDWAAESTNFPSEVVEMALAHTVANQVEAAYRRGDLFEKRRKLMEAWVRYCSRPAVTGEVVQLRKGM